MTPSNKRDIISRVKYIHSNRVKMRNLETEMEELKGKINTLANETNHKLGNLHTDMGPYDDLKIKIDGEYYILDRKVTGVVIRKFQVIDEKNI
jgi:hypothetical protein|tara:strand:- start:1552 stop:1830 length:279 start_codon:yes stop_codon:yes gene_type:complete